MNYELPCGMELRIYHKIIYIVTVSCRMAIRN